MKRKFKYILGQFLNNLTSFTTFLESESERRAYEVLRSTGYSFKKQCRIDPYRLDFYLPEYHVCIEIDGKCHLGRSEQDNKRDRILLTYKIRTLRIPAGELYKKNYEKMILKKLKEIISKPIF
jgi:very-short-patch-repair endonuclease